MLKDLPSRKQEKLAVLKEVSTIPVDVTPVIPSSGSGTLMMIH